METKEMVLQDIREMDEIRHCTSAEPVRIRVLKPLKRQDATYISYLKSRMLRVEEIHLSSEGDVISSEDGKFVLEKQKDGSMMLDFSAEQERAVIPEGVKVIDHKAFAGSKIREVIMPDTVESISLKAFVDCKNLKKVRFSQKLKLIGSDAFFGCGSLTEADLPDSLRTIKDEAFEKCCNLKIRKLPDNLQGVSDCAFMGCSFAEEIALPASVKHIGNLNLTNAKYVRLNEANIRCAAGGIISSMRKFYHDGFICFRIEGRNIVFPKSMTGESAEEARRILCEYKELPAGTYTHYELASSEQRALNTALFGYSISHDPQLRKYLTEALQEHGSELFQSAAESGEETLLQLITFLDGDLLTEPLRLCALDTAREYDMISASALCLQLSMPRKLNSFCL